MRRKIRLYFWFVKGIWERYYKIILLSFALGLALVVISFGSGKAFRRDTAMSQKVIIGLVGAYSPSNLPISLQRLISLGLTDVNTAGEVIPALATSWDISEDSKEYLFHLRTDLFWHDGKKFTAYDVNYNLKDVIFEPLSESQLKVKLKDAFTPLPNFLSKALFRKGLIGLGSYKIDGIRLKGETVSYLKLVPMTPELPPIEIKFYTSENQAKTAFKLGEVTVLDEITDPTPFEKWNNLIVKSAEKNDRYVGVFFNLEHPLLAQKEVRQALAFALDKDEKSRIATPISTSSWAYTNQVKQYEKDLDLAKKLFTDSSSSSSASITLSTFSPYLPLAQTIASSWEAIGVSTRIKIEHGLPETYEVLLVTQEIPSDPDQYTLWHSTQTQTNISHYASPKIDKLLEDGRKERDIEKRKKIYFDFQRYLVEDAPAIFLFHPTTYTISRK